MKNTAPALIALLVAVLALCVALLRRPEPLVQAQASFPADAVEDEALGERVAGIESELARLADEIELLRSSSPGTREAVASGAGESAALAARVVELERRLAELQGARTATSPEVVEVLRRATESRAQDRKKGIDHWTGVALDGAATEEQRLQALRNLRGARLPDGTDARLTVLPDMIRLAESSQDARVRADVWRQLSRVGDRSLVAPLLNALQNDPLADVREEAAETLGDYLPEPGVVPALQFAAENDASAEVRAQAIESLGGRRR